MNLLYLNRHKYANLINCITIITLLITIKIKSITKVTDSITILTCLIAMIHIDNRLSYLILHYLTLFLLILNLLRQLFLLAIT